MPHQTRTFRVFISSTFNDWQLERDVLQKNVWPAMERLCAEKGCRFQAIDLRWGVSEEAIRSAHLLDICLGEIRRSQRLSPRPNFVTFVGNRYGYCPLPEKINDQEFRAIIQKMPTPERTFLAGGESGLGWYRLDENAQTPGVADRGIWQLQGWSGRCQTNFEWLNIEREIRRLLRNGAKCLADAQRLKYEMSLTEQEFECGVGDSAQTQPHVLAFIREIESIPSVLEDQEAHKYINWIGSGDNWIQDPDASQCLRRFKKRILAHEGRRLRRLFRYQVNWSQRESEAYLLRICQDVQEALTSIITEEIEKFAPATSVAQETQAHAEFASERSRFFIGRNTELDQIIKYAREGRGRAFVLAGEPGSGKSALMAQAISLSRAQMPHAALLYRSCGATPTSSNEITLLSSLCSELGASPLAPSIKKSDYQVLTSAFADALKAAASNKRVVLFLDGIDQLIGPLGDRPALGWIANSLPPNVAIVMSCLTPAVPLGLSPSLTLKSLPASEAWSVVEQRLRYCNRRLMTSQEEVVRSKLQICGLPLYATLLADVAAGWASFDNPSSLSDNIRGLIAQLIDHWSSPERYGRALVPSVLAYLGASQNGLSESELVGLLAADDEVWQDILDHSKYPLPERKLPMTIWSRLYMELMPFLRELPTENGALFAFYHRIMFEVVADKFLADVLSRRERHLRMARFFEASQPAHDPRRLIELPRHLYKAESWTTLAKVLSTEEFRRSLWMNWGTPRHDEFIRYWKTIEAESSLLASDAYRSALSSFLPASFDTVLILRLMVELGHDDEALECLEQMIHMCRVLENVSDFCDYLDMKANILQKRGDFDGALTVLKEEENVKAQHYNRQGISLRMAKLGFSREDCEKLASECSTDDPELNMAPSWAKQAALLTARGDFEAALTLHLKEAEVYRRNHEGQALALSLMNQGNIHKKLDRLHRARKILQEATELFRKAGDNTGVADALNFQAEVLYRLKDQAGIVPLLEEAARILQASGHREALHITLGRLGETLTLLGEPHRARNFFSELKQVCQREGDEAGARMCERALLGLASPRVMRGCVDPDADAGMDFFQRGMDLFDQQKWQEAIPLLAKAEALLRKGGNRRIAREALNRHCIAMRMSGETPTDEMMRREVSDMIFLVTGKDVPLHDPPRTG